MFKKIICLMVLMMSVFFLSCSSESSQVPVNSTTDETTDILSSDATTTMLDSYSELGFEYEMLTYDNPEFDAEITDIEFDVLQRKIRFHYHINDYSSSKRYYFVYGYEHDDFRPFHPISTFDSKESDDYVLDLFYDERNPEEFVTVEMGRFSSSVSVIGERPDSNSVGFRYRINDIINRGIVDDFTVKLTRDDVDEFHQAKLRVTAHDPDQTIQSLKVVITPVFETGIIVAERNIAIDSNMRSGEGFNISDILFEQLSPNVWYQATVYISGNDGLFDFTDTLLGYSQTSMGEWNFIEDAYHDLYCEIHSSTLIGETIDLFFVLKNGGSYLIDDAVPEIYLNIYHSDTDTEPYFSVKIGEGTFDRNLSVPGSQMYDILKIEDEDKTIVLAKTALFPE